MRGKGERRGGLLGTMAEAAFALHTGQARKGAHCGRRSSSSSTASLVESGPGREKGVSELLSGGFQVPTKNRGIWTWPMHNCSSPLRSKPRRRIQITWNVLHAAMRGVLVDTSSCPHSVAFTTMKHTACQAGPAKAVWLLFRLTAKLAAILRLWWKREGGPRRRKLQMRSGSGPFRVSSPSASFLISIISQL